LLCTPRRLAIHGPALLAASLAAAAGTAQAGLSISAQPSAGFVTFALQSGSAAPGHLALLPAGASCGTVAQIQAGLDGTGGPALRRGSMALPAGAGTRYTVRNLAQGSNYTVCATNGTETASTAFSTRPMDTWASATWQVVGIPAFSAGDASDESLSLAPDGTPYVAYSDNSIGGRTTVMRFDGTAWVSVGSPGFSAAWARYQSLSFAPDGSPHVAFMDYANGQKATVMRFDGTAWVNVGTPGFSAGAANFVSLSFAPDGTPHAAFQDNGVTQVMRFDGTAWVPVGGSGPASAQGAYQSLGFAPDGSPHVAFSDASRGGRASVMRFDGTAWANVGAAGFTTASSSFQSLSFAPDGTPHVAFQDAANGGRTTVMRFDGAAWRNVGSPGFSGGWSDSQSLSFAPDGTPHVAFRDYANGEKTTVMRFDGSAWADVGRAGFSNDQAKFQSLSFAPDGRPYVAYQDNGLYNGSITVMRLIGTAAAPAAVTAAANGSHQATVAFAPSASDGGSPVTRYTATAMPGGASCTATPPATSCVVAGLAAGQSYTFQVVATNGAGDGAASPPSAPMATAALLDTPSLPLPGGRGDAAVVIGGGLAGCSVVPGSVQFGSTAPAGSPANASFPFGVFSFRATGCVGATLTVSITYPQSLAALSLQKFGPPATNQPARWFTPGSLALSNNSRTVSYQVADNGEGDSDPGAGDIADPFAPMLLAVAPSGTAAIPTLGEWGLALMSVLAAALGMAALRRRQRMA
jgi:hypothetical protein